MSWIEKLYETYDATIGNETIPDFSDLCPVGYSTQMAHVEIAIDGQGNYRRASIIEKGNNPKTMIPVTEKSQTGRTSGIAPHPLCDTIQYCAGDYKAFGGVKESYFENYCFSKKDFETEDEEIANQISPILLRNKLLEASNKNRPKMKADRCLRWLNLSLALVGIASNPSFADRQRENRKYLESTYPNLCPVNSTSYLAQLERWVTSGFTHSKAVAVFNYVRKRTVVADLVKDGCLAVTDGKLALVRKKVKNDNEKHPVFKMLTFDDTGVKDQGKVFIRWIVDEKESLCTQTWRDKTLHEAWRIYIDSSVHNVGFCYVKGEEAPLARKHPAKLRSGKDGAKLVSSNDLSGYTFLGRFASAEQAAGLSSEVTQKAHNVLRWLIGRKQACKNGNQVFVTWAIAGKEIPDPFASSLDFLGDIEEPILPQATGDVGQSFAFRLNKKIAGYKADITDTDDIVLLGLDSATPGRMAITFFRELKGSEFLARIENWHLTFAWHQIYGSVSFIGVPAPKEIALNAYGKKAETKNGIKLLNATVERLLPCITDGAKFPQDIVESSLRRVNNRLAFKKDKVGNREYENEWEKCLGITCSLINGYHNERRYQMALEDDRATRDYLFGRLLAVAEKIETMALFYAKEKRDTTAARYMQRFADRPLSTWRTIENSLSPYKARIHSKNPPLLSAYLDLIDKIMHTFKAEDFTKDERLTGEYLLGYHCQRYWLKVHKREKNAWVLKQQDEDTIEEIDKCNN